jgi:putative ABC transport system permease protein
MLNDLRFGWHILRKNRGTTAVACISLALGIGAATAMFSVIDAVLLNPFPYRAADRIVGFELLPVKSGPSRGIHLVQEYLQIRALPDLFEDCIANTWDDLTLTGGREPELLSGIAVSGNTFTFLGVAPLLGRGIVTADEGQHVAVLDYKTWNKRFGADRGVIGRSIELNNAKYTIIGVMPSRFGWRGAEVWIPLTLDPTSPKLVSIRGRLRTGVTIAAATEHLLALHRRMAPWYPRFYPRDGFIISIYTLRDGVMRQFRTTLYILFGAVALLLAIACANVANLQLVRATERQREIAIRVAAGASRVRLVRQLLTESVMLAAIGAASGVALAFWGTRCLVMLMPPFSIPNEARISVNGRVLLFSAIAVMATGVLFGLAPAIGGSRPDLIEALKEGGRGSGHGRSSARIRSSLVALEMALALILLVGAGLMLRSLAAYRDVDLGFRPENVLTLRIPLSPARYPRPDQRNLFCRMLLERLTALPGIESAALSNAMPPWSNTAGDFAVEGRPAQEQIRTAVYFVSRDYFRTLGVRLLRGDLFRDQDEARGERTAVISDFMAGHFFGEDPIGRRVRIGLLQNAGQDPWRIIIGVVSTMKNNGVKEDPRPAVYLPYVAQPGPFRVVLARTTRNPLSFGGAVRAQVAAIDKDQVIGEISTVDQELRDEEAQPRFSVALTTAFGAVGLLLAAIGIYSVVSYTVSRRTQEIGVRMALGAEPARIVMMVLRSGLRLALIGIAFGALGAWSLTRLIKHLLFKVSPTDPWSFVMASLILTAAALAACCIPARRAARTDPQEALRCE